MSNGRKIIISPELRGLFLNGIGLFSDCVISSWAFCTGPDPDEDSLFQRELFSLMNGNELEFAFGWVSRYPK